MKKTIFLTITFCAFIAVATAQQTDHSAVKHFNEMARAEQADFKKTIKKKGLLTKEEWRVLIDKRRMACFD